MPGIRILNITYWILKLLNSIHIPSEIWSQKKRYHTRHRWKIDSQKDG